MTSRPSLVNRRTAQTRLDIVTAATALFRKQGFDDTSMTEIAVAAGVSRRTLYRYFPTKEDIVFESPREWLEIFESVVATRRPGESTRDVIERAVLTVAEHLVGRRDRIVEEFAILQSSVALRARRGRSDDEWIERYLELLAPDVVAGPEGLRQAVVCAMALRGAQNALVAVWATGPADVDLLEMTGRTLAQVDSLWPAGAR